MIDFNGMSTCLGLCYGLTYDTLVYDYLSMAGQSSSRNSLEQSDITSNNTIVIPILQKQLVVHFGDQV